MKRFVFPLLLVLVFSGLYLSALPSGLTPGDGAELIYGIKNFQVVHPPGYPLYLVMNRSLARLTGLSYAWSGHLFSALCGILGLLFLYYYLEKRQLSRSVAAVAVLFTGLVFPFWSVCTKVEVYSLTFLFFTAALYFYEKSLQNGWRGDLLWFWVGLSLTHHPLALFNLPLAADEARQKAWHRLPAKIVLLLGPGLLYLLLLLPGQNGPFNWPQIGNLPALIEHMTGGTFTKFFLAAGGWGVLEQLGGVVAVNFFAFTPLVTLVLIYGLLNLRGREKKLVFLHLGLIGLLALYTVPDFADFLIIAYGLSGIYLARGLEELSTPQGSKFLAGFSVVLLLTFGLSSIYLELPYWPERKQNFWQEYARTAERQVGEQGVIVSDWYHYTPLRFHQLEENYFQPNQLVSAARLLEKWPQLIRVYHRSDRLVYTTFKDWHRPPSWSLKKRGYLFLVRLNSED